MKKILAVLLGLLLVLMTAAAMAEDDTVQVEVELEYCYDNTESMLTLVNDFRTSDTWMWSSDDTEKIEVKGLTAFVYDYGLEEVAMKRAAECAVHYAHTRPDGESCFSIYPPSGAGENIAAGYRTKEAVFTGWKEEDEKYSGQGHRRNMLSESMTHIGIGCVKANGVYFWCQAFGTGATGKEKSALKGPAVITASIAVISDENDKQNGKLEDVAAAPDSLRIPEGESVALPAVEATAGWGSVPVKMTGLSWTASDTSVVSVAGGKAEGLKGGKTTLKTTAGSDVSVDVVVVCKEHTWNDGEVQKAATCLEDGVRLLTCKACGETEEETIPKIPHQLSKTDRVEPTCAKTGMEAYWTCALCKKLFSDEAAENEIAEPVVIEKLPHTPVTDARVEPTCTEDGLTEGSHCSVCSEVLKAQEKIPMLGHAWDEGVVTKEATYAEDGIRLFTCSRCKETREEAISIAIELGQSGWVRMNDGSMAYGDASGRAVVGPREIDGTLYCFNEQGKMITGWAQLGEDWYYADNSGAAANTGWKQIKGSWYYFSRDGKMATGWIRSGGQWYYLKADGAMATGWLEDGNKWYYLKDSGAAATGWLRYGNTWYYLLNNGEMATGWIAEGGNWYYMKDSGAMAVGWVQDDGKWYYMNENGQMITGWLQYRNAWYLMQPSGAMTTGWARSGGQWYYFRESGAMAANEWIEDKEAEKKLPEQEKRELWYWFDSDGNMAIGWKIIKGQWEYFSPSGEWLYTWIGY